MFTQFEEKGKVFTNVVTKKPALVHIQTTSHLIRGKVHVRPDERLKDELNQNEMFIAVTDAVIFDNLGNTKFQCGFLAVNREQIVWLFQDEDTEERTEEE